VSVALHLELVIRILVGTALGGVIGYERDVHGRPAGLRTHALVALASATFMVVSTHFVYAQQYRISDHVDVDGSRIAASVVSGIGFLAGGAILRTGLNVQGLTTAAGLWLVSAIGLAAGGGMYVESVAGTLCGIAVLTVLRRFEDKDDRTVRRRLSLTLGQNAPTLSAIVARLTALGARVTQEDYEKHVDERTRHVTLDVRLPAAVSSEQVLEALEVEPGVRRIKIVPLG
jgi:putative Mg2+ transporter-C (MgtC) family protein